MKRFFDILFSIIVLILLSPLFIVIAVLILASSGTPIFFKQNRVGKDWQIFKIIKFRTMVNDADKLGPGISLNDDARITFTGKILRKFKLDEIPQFINVLKGNMSIIGPRPELFEYANYYRTDYIEILQVKPGISDFASIAFRDEAALINNTNDIEKFYLNEILPQKIKLYKKYLKEMCFLTDLKIFFTTLKVIFLW